MRSKCCAILVDVSAGTERKELLLGNRMRHGMHWLCSGTARESVVQEDGQNPQRPCPHMALFSERALTALDRRSKNKEQQCFSGTLPQPLHRGLVWSDTRRCAAPSKGTAITLFDTSQAKCFAKRWLGGSLAVALRCVVCCACSTERFAETGNSEPSSCCSNVFQHIVWSVPLLKRCHYIECTANPVAGMP